jgi:hypothetical protein
MTRVSLAVLGLVALFGCGDAKGPDEVALTSSDLVGTWSTPTAAPTGYAGCAFAVTFAADGTYGAGNICTAETLPPPPEPPSFQLDVDWVTGAFTAAPSGRINFLPAEHQCTSDLANFHADYSGQTSRPTITIPWPSGDLVLSPSATPPFSEDAVFGCFAASDWTFTPSPVP